MFDKMSEKANEFNKRVNEGRWRKDKGVEVGVAVAKSRRYSFPVFRRLEKYAHLLDFLSGLVCSFISCNKKV